MPDLNLGDLFTEKEFTTILKEYLGSTHTFHNRALEIVRPLMPRINQLTGQENDENYMAYALEFILMNVKKKS